MTPPKVRSGRAVAAPLVVAAWVLALGLLLPRLAHAQDWSSQCIFSASIGYTDNVAFTPTPRTSDAPQPEADVFSVLSPGLAVSYATPRTLHRLTYVFSTDLFF